MQVVRHLHHNKAICIPPPPPHPLKPSPRTADDDAACTSPVSEAICSWLLIPSVTLDYFLPLQRLPSLFKTGTSFNGESESDVLSLWRFTCGMINRVPLGLI